MPQVSSSNPPATGEHRSGFRLRVTFPAILALLAVAGVVYAMARNQDVTGVKLGEGGVEVAFASSSSLSAAEIQAKQKALEKSVRSLEARAQKQGARGGTGAGSRATLNLSGDWRGSNGVAYRIDQYGARGVITEMGPWGITAVGEGNIGRNAASFLYQAADGSSGEARFQVVDKSTLEGRFVNFTYGTTTPIRLAR